MSDFTVQVTDSDSPVRSAERAFRLDVSEWVPPPVVPVVMWDNYELYEPERSDGSMLVVQNFNGWYGTPGGDTRDVSRELVDGMVPGPKTIGPAEMTLEGIVEGATRITALQILDAIAQRAASYEPTIMIVSNLLGTGPGRYEQRQVRAVGKMDQQWLTQRAFTYSVPLRATDPRRYSTEPNRIRLWRQEGDTGRRYDMPEHPFAGRRYSWQYASETTGTTAILENNGNVPAPVLITYQSPLGQSRLTDGRRSILLDPMNSGRFYVNSETLAIWADGGFSRARWLQAGSQQMMIPPGGTRWSLYVPEARQGYVELEWRSAWL